MDRKQEYTATFHHEQLRLRYQQQFVFLPFGAGARKCLGQQFAILETKLAIASMLYFFDIVSIDSQPIPGSEVT